MYLSVSMYVCMYSLCVCMYTCNACCDASTQTNLLLLSLLLGGPNPFGGGGGGPRTRNPGSYIQILYKYSTSMLSEEDNKVKGVEEDPKVLDERLLGIDLSPEPLLRRL